MSRQVNGGAVGSTGSGAVIKLIHQVQSLERTILRSEKNLADLRSAHEQMIGRVSLEVAELRKARIRAEERTANAVNFAHHMGRENFGLLMYVRQLERLVEADCESPTWGGLLGGRWLTPESIVDVE